LHEEILEIFSKHFQTPNHNLDFSDTCKILFSEMVKETISVDKVIGSRIQFIANISLEHTDGPATHLYI